MSRQRFIVDKRARWRRLEEILRYLERKGARRTDEGLLDEFVDLYQTACSDLAKVRTEAMGDDVEDYLNAIVGRAYKQFHPPTPPKLVSVLVFFASDFPVSVRAIGFYVLAAALLFALPLAGAALVVAANPEAAYVLSPPEQLEMLAEAYAEGHAKGRSEKQDSLMTGYYINNNIGIAFKCFATGVFFGLGSIFFLMVNGIIGGAVGAYIASAGYSTSFFSFVVGHGAFELTAIVLSGAAGLRLGSLLVNPGRLTRQSALRQEAPLMARVIVGAAAMLLVAALIEGFWSPSGAPPAYKFAVGGVLWVFVVFYLSFAGRGNDKICEAKR